MLESKTGKYKCQSFIGGFFAIGVGTRFLFVRVRRVLIVGFAGMVLGHS
jgi:hypothetical protein